MACETCHKVYSPTESIFLDSDAKPHLCHTCGKSFSLKIQLKRHIMTHANGAPYTCYACEKGCDNNSKTYNLRLSKKGTHTCEECNASFNTRRLLLSHSKEHEMVDNISCDECDETFGTEAAFRKHALSHRNKRTNARQNLKKAVEKSHNCSECGKYFSDLRGFEKHCLSHKKHVCEDCNKSFISFLALEKHRVNKKCKVSFEYSVKTESTSSVSSENNSESHVKSTRGSSSSDRKHTCDICGKSFSRKSSLEGHLFVHYPDKDLYSEEDDDFHDADYVIEPEEKQDKASDEFRLPKLKIRTKFPCETCKETFPSEVSLKKHELMHRSSKEVKTEQEEPSSYGCCGEDFESSKGLDDHKADVHGVKKHKKKVNAFLSREQNTYMCNICDKVFYRKRRLKRHYLFHENKLDDDISSDDMDNIIKRRKSREKNFSCEICGKRFAGKTCLDKHVLKHSKETKEGSENASAPKRRKRAKILTCEFCNEDFTGRKNSFIKHRNFHTPEVCGICDERFVDRQALREHCRVHIGTEEGRIFLECSQKAFNAKNGVVQPEPKVEYIYLVLR